VDLRELDEYAGGDRSGYDHEQLQQPDRVHRHPAVKNGALWPCVLAVPVLLAAAGIWLFSGKLTVSTDGTAIPPAARIVDAGGNIWTVNNGQVSRNGVADTDTADTPWGGVKGLRYSGDEIYKHVCGWLSLKTTEWPAGAKGWQQMPIGYAIALTDCPSMNPAWHPPGAAKPH
jgi:hypothetical protein